MTGDHTATDCDIDLFLLARVLFRHLCVSFMWKVFHLATRLVNAESKEPQNISEHHRIHSVESVPERHSEQYRHHLWQIRLSKASKSIQTTMTKTVFTLQSFATATFRSKPMLFWLLFDCYLVSIFARTSTKELNATWSTLSKTWWPESRQAPRTRLLA